MTTKVIRDKVLQRDQSTCWHCGETEAISIQHRQNRGMGGSKTRDRLDNLIVLCSAQNLLIESDAMAAALARDYGWKLNSWDHYSQPLLDMNLRRWYRLDEKGNKFETEPPSYLI
jgi:hypothetical protein